MAGWSLAVQKNVQVLILAIPAILDAIPNACLSSPAKREGTIGTIERI